MLIIEWIATADLTYEEKMASVSMFDLSPLNDAEISAILKIPSSQVSQTFVSVMRKLRSIADRSVLED